MASVEEGSMKLRFATVVVSSIMLALLVSPLAVLGREGDGAAPVVEALAALQAEDAGRNPGGFTVAGPSAEVVVNGDTGTSASLTFQEAGVTAWRFLHDHLGTDLVLGTPSHPSLFLFGPEGKLSVLSAKMRGTRRQGSTGTLNERE
jgi:hypothetical protein